MDEKLIKMTLKRIIAVKYYLQYKKEILPITTKSEKEIRLYLEEKLTWCYILEYCEKDLIKHDPEYDFNSDELDILIPNKYIFLEATKICFDLMFNTLPQLKHLLLGIMISPSLDETSLISLINSSINLRDFIITYILMTSNSKPIISKL
jgi:hypothetical protein